MLTSSLRAEERRGVFAPLFLILLSASGFAAAVDDSRMKIQMTLNGAVIATATLDDNDSAKDFAALLPLDLPLKDYAATEKIADLPHKLSTKGAPEAYTPAAGDISFYAPWGNLAIFYKDGHLSAGLVRLGRLNSGLDVVRRLGPVTVRVERTRP